MLVATIVASWSEMLAQYGGYPCSVGYPNLHVLRCEAGTGEVKVSGRWKQDGEDNYDTQA